MRGRVAGRAGGGSRGTAPPSPARGAGRSRGGGPSSWELRRHSAGPVLPRPLPSPPVLSPGLPSHPQRLGPNLPSPPLSPLPPASQLAAVVVTGSIRPQRRWRASEGPVRPVAPATSLSSVAVVEANLAKAGRFGRNLPRVQRNCDENSCRFVFYFEGNQ